MKKLAVFASLLMAFGLKAQNLVENPSFEDPLFCPYSDTLALSEIISPWNSYFGTPDYYHPCGFPGSDSATNNSLPFDGQGFVGIEVYGDNGGGTLRREYVHSELSEPLEAGKFYRVGFYVKPLNNDLTGQSFGINNLGMLLTDSIIDTIPTDAVLDDYQPQVEVDDPIIQTNFWTPVCGIYKAKGGERYLTIGNFKDDISTSATPLENSMAPQRAYVMIDYVEVVENDIPQLPADTVICQEGRIDLRIAGPNISVMWSDETTDPNFIITNPGLYTARISNGACTYLDSILVEQINCEECILYAPTAFTPNGDRLNDVFTIEANCLDDGYLLEYDLRIFDKWGRKVFESQSPRTGWDGGDEPQGVYSYTIEYRFNSERETKTRVKRGFVTIYK